MDFRRWVKNFDSSEVNLEMRWDWKEGTLEGVRLTAKKRATKDKAQKADWQVRGTERKASRLE